MNERCPRFNTCYFPKNITKGKHERKEFEKYLNSCNYRGMECELAKLSDIEFKLMEAKEDEN